jgi:hypothetical protein
MQNLEAKFKSRAAINRGSYILFTKAIALEFIDACEKEGAKVLGIDAFHKIDDETIRPDIENSVDFSSSPLSGIENAYQSARDFLEKREDTLFFEIVWAQGDN